MSSRKASRGVLRARNPFEIAIFVLAILAIAVIVGGLVVAGLGNDGPVRLGVEVERVRPDAAGDVVELVVRNDGNETAEDVVVTVKAGTEEREVTIARVAKQDEEQASVILPPGSGAGARAEIAGYTEP